MPNIIMLSLIGYWNRIAYCIKDGNRNKFHYNNGNLIDNKMSGSNSGNVCKTFVSSNDVINNSNNNNRNKCSNYILYKNRYIN